MANAMQFLQPIDLVKNELRNAVIQVLSAAPSSPVEGQVYYDSTLHEFGYYNGTTWIYSVTVPDATNGAKGIMELANDLGGTAALPTVVDLHLAGDTAINHKLTSVTDPGSAQDAATKNYVDIRRLDQAAAPTADVSLNSHKLTNVTDPTVAQDAATKNYVDGKINGIAWKQPVACMAVAADVAATTFAYVAGGADTLTANANGAIGLIDGYQPVLGDRILVNNTGATTVKNGIWTVTAVGDGTHPFVLTRAADAQTGAQLQDATVLVENGTTYGDTVWNCANGSASLAIFGLTFTGNTTSGVQNVTSVSAAVVTKIAAVTSPDSAPQFVSGPGSAIPTIPRSAGTSGTTTVTTLDPAGTTQSGGTFALEAALRFVQIQSATAVTADGVYLTRSGNTIQPVAVPGDPTAGANGSVVATAAALARSMRFAIKGDGSTVNFTLTHNFANRLVEVTAQKDSSGTPSDPIVIGWTPTSANAVQLQFVTAPTAGTVYYATVVG